MITWAKLLEFLKEQNHWSCLLVCMFSSPTLKDLTLTLLSPSEPSPYGNRRTNSKRHRHCLKPTPTGKLLRRPTTHRRGRRICRKRHRGRQPTDSGARGRRSWNRNSYHRHYLHSAGEEMAGLARGLRVPAHCSGRQGRQHHRTQGRTHQEDVRRDSSSHSRSRRCCWHSWSCCKSQFNCGSHLILSL